MKLLVWLVLAAALTAVFDRVTKGERRHYEALVAAWKDGALPLAQVEAECRRVAGQSGDSELKFMASYLCDLANMYGTAGYPTLGRVRTSSDWEAFGRGFLAGFVNPATVFKVIPLWWNSDRFEREGKMLAERYGYFRFGPACCALLVSGLLAFGGSALMQQGRKRAATAQSTRVRETEPAV